MGGLSRFSGILGVVLFLFGVASSVLLQSYSHPLVVGHVVLGTALVLLWLATTGASSLSEAGGVIAGRTTRFGASALVYGALFLAVLVSVNWFVARHDKRWDLTAEGVYSLAPQSASVIEKLDRPLKLVGFKVGENPEALEDLLALYRQKNPGRVTTSMVDPRTKPQLVQSYGMKQGNLLYIEYGEGDTKQVSRVNDATEEAVTNAVLKLAKGSAKKVYYVTGHGEPDVVSGNQGGMKGFADALQDEHVKVETVLLSKAPEVPSDAAALLLVAPKSPLLPEEKSVLTKYVDGGGRLVMFTDPRGGDDVKAIAAGYGIAVGDDVILDQVQRLFAGPAIGAQPVVQTFDPHPITRAIPGGGAVVLNIARSVKKGDKTVEGAVYTELMKTGPNSWAESDLARIFDAEEPGASLDTASGDVQGPVPVGVVYDKKLPAPEGEKKGEGEAFDRHSRLVVFGDSDFVSNGQLGVYANRDLALNAVAWAMGEEGSVTIRPKSVKESFAPIDAATFQRIAAASIILPELFLLAGLFVWWSRRHVSAR